MDTDALVMTGDQEPSLEQKQAGRESTRRAILDAGRFLFAQHGYKHTSLRQVAARAGVNLALVNRYFGSKENLFRAALESAISVEPMRDIPLVCFGEEVGRRFFVPGATSRPLEMIALSISDPAAMVIAGEILERRVLRPLALYLGEPDGAGRAARLNMLWSGFVMSWRLLPPGHGGASLASLRAWLERETQAIVDEGRRTGEG